MQTISIFIPVYNAEAFLEDAIKSILAQTFQLIRAVMKFLKNVRKIALILIY